MKKSELKSIIKEEIIKFTQAEMSSLHKDGKLEKDGNTYEFNES